jgi:hypothetical protein
MDDVACPHIHAPLGMRGAWQLSIVLGIWPRRTPIISAG